MASCFHCVAQGPARICLSPAAKYPNMLMLWVSEWVSVCWWGSCSSLLNQIQSYFLLYVLIIYLFYHFGIQILGRGELGWGHAWLHRAKRRWVDPACGRHYPRCAGVVRSACIRVFVGLTWRVRRMHIFIHFVRTQEKAFVLRAVTARDPVSNFGTGYLNQVDWMLVIYHRKHKLNAFCDCKLIQAHGIFPLAFVKPLSKLLQTAPWFRSWNFFMFFDLIEVTCRKKRRFTWTIIQIG